MFIPEGEVITILFKQKFLIALLMTSSLLITALTGTPVLAQSTPPTQARAGIYVDAMLDPEVWTEDWSAALPEAWRSASEDTALYKVRVRQMPVTVQRCSYMPDSTLIRRQWNVDVRVINLETEATITATTFYGAAPGECAYTESFEWGSTIKYRDGNPPTSAEFVEWLMDTVPDDMPGLIELTPTPGPPASPTLLPPPPAEAARLSDMSNWDWTPNIWSVATVDMVEVPAGCFSMGSRDLWEDTMPVHGVCLDAFWIDRIEVTNGQYIYWGGAPTAPSVWDGVQQPVEQITWAEATQFCQMRGGARLPTEAEWEYAARGPDSWIYPWGNEFSSENVIYNVSAPWDAGGTPGGASWVGAEDMSGNISEWVSDWYGPYTSEWQTNPTGPESGEAHIFRGGSFNVTDPLNLQPAGRYRMYSDGTNYTIGFRCARSALN